MQTTIPPHTYYYPYELDQFAITGLTGDVPVQIIILPDTTIFSATLTPDATGRLTFTDIGHYLSERITAHTLGTFDPARLQIIVSGQTLADLTIFPCTAPLTATADDILTHNFLTPAVAGPKLIPITAEQELLTWYVHQPTEADHIHITAQWLDTTTGTRCQMEYNIPPSRGTDYIKQADVAPHLLTAPTIPGTWQLAQYQATLGSRIMQYTIAPHGATAQTTPTTLTFRNIFGHLDTFYLYGTTTIEAKPTYTSARISGLTHNYQVEVTPTYKCDTGHMPLGTYTLLTDLITARHIWHDGQPITLTEAEVKPTSSPHDLRTATITYRAATDGITHTHMLPASTFDQSFDRTFN